MTTGSTHRKRSRAARAGWRRVTILGLAIAALLAGIDWVTGGPTRTWMLGSAELDVTTDPKGAELVVDGVLQGLSPLTIRVAPGARTLLVRHPYHPPHVEHLTLARDARLARRIELEPGYGSLRVASNPKGARVTLDGVEQGGVTPLLIEPVVAGRRELVVQLPARRPARLETEVLPGERVEVSAELERARTGVLQVATTPSGAEAVLIDEFGARHRPGTPVPEGRYTLRVTSPGYRSQEQAVTVSPGERSTTVTLEPMTGRLDLTVEPAAARVTVTYGRGATARTRDYVGAMELPAGPATVEARAPGHRPLRRTLEIADSPVQLHLRLQRFQGRPGDRIQDTLESGGQAPTMAVLPTGQFVMGAAAHAVTIDTPFAIGVYEVTRGDWTLYVAATGRPMPAARDGETARHAIDRVDYAEAEGYAAWLSAQTGARYRLPSSTEWEYAARAGDTNRYPGAQTPEGLCAAANVADAALATRFRAYETVDCDDGQIRAAPVGQYEPNHWGLYDVIGNVGEWTASCWDSTPGSPPTDDATCGSRVVRGGSWDTAASGATLAAAEPASSAGDGRGFRLLREL